MFILIEFKRWFKPRLYRSEKHIGLEFLFIAIRFVFMSFQKILSVLQNKKTKGEVEWKRNSKD